MSTSNKLTYLNETKQELKQAINNIGGEVTDETTFRQYVSQLENVYDNLPKTSFQEGTSVTIENGLKGKIDFEDGIVGYGDTSQESTTGKNIYPSGTSTQTIGGITFTPQIDGGIKLQGTSTYSNYYVAGGESNYVDVPNLSNLAETVTLSVSGMQEGIQVYVVGQTLGAKGTSVSGSIGFTTTANDKYRLFIRVMANNTVNTTLYIQLEKGSSATSFEKYTNGASPNPSYPQEVKVVRGKNRLKPITIDRTIKGVKITSNDNGKITIKGTATDSINDPIWGSWGGSNVLCELPQGNYVSSGLGTNSPRLNIVANGTTTIFTGNSTKTLTSTAKITGIFLYVNNGESVDMTFEPMLEKGSQATSYLPYNTIEIVERGINEFKPTLTYNDTTIIASNCSVTVSEDDFTFVATRTDMRLGEVANANNSYTGIYGYLIEIPENATNVYLMVTNNQFDKHFITFYDKDKISLGFYSITTSKAIPSGAKYCTFRIGKSDSVADTTYTTKIMVAFSSINTYEPYQEPKTYQLSLGEYEFAKIGDYADELLYDVENDKVYKNEKIGKYTFTGEEEWTQSGYTTNDYLCCFCSVGIDIGGATELVTDILSNRFKAGSYTQSLGNLISSSNNPNGFNLCIDKNIASNVTALQTYFANNPTYALYIHKTNKPLIELTDTTLKAQVKALYNAHSNNGTTIITSYGNLPMIIKVRALKGE